MSRQRARAAFAFCVAALLALPLALSSPASARDDFAVRSPFPLTITGPQARGETTLTLPKGTRAVRLIGRVTSTYSRPGALVVTVNNRVVRRLPSTEGGPVRVSLRGTATPRGEVRVGLALRLLPRDICFDTGSESASLQGLRVRYRSTGAAPPSSVASFMQGAPRSVTVTTDLVPSPSEQQAVLNAVTVATSAFGPGTRVAYAPEQVLPKLTGVDRVIRVSEGGPTALTVEDGVLTVSGPPDSLTRSVLSLSSDYLPIAGEPVAASPSARSEDLFGDLSQTLDELGLPVTPLSGIGESTLNLSIDQTAFGRPISGITVDLKGTVTPVIRGTGWINVLWNSEMVASTPLTDSSSYAASVRLGPEQVQRGNSLGVQLQYQPREGCRGRVLPARLDLDPNSVVTASAGQALSGFATMPQTLGQVTPVAFGDPDRPVESLRDAAHVLSGLQRLTRRLVQVQLLGWDAFVADNRPGLAVGITPEQDGEVDAPLRLAPFRTVDGQTESLTASVDGSFAALQVYDRGRRPLIVLGGTGERSRKLMAMLSRRADGGINRNGGWASLTGGIAVAQPGQPIAFLSEASVAVQPEKISERSILRSGWLLAAVGVVTVVLVGGVVVRWARRRAVG